VEAARETDDTVGLFANPLIPCLDEITMVNGRKPKK
jgi:hypothetical protein